MVYGNDDGTEGVVCACRHGMQGNLKIHKGLGHPVGNCLPCLIENKLSNPLPPNCAGHAPHAGRVRRFGVESVPGRVR